MNQVTSALARAIWIFSICLLVAAVARGVGGPLFSLIGLSALSVASLVAGWFLRKRAPKEEELSPGTAYPTRKVRRERPEDDRARYRREPKVEDRDEVPKPKLKPEPAIGSGDKIVVPVDGPNAKQISPGGETKDGPKLGPAVSVRRDFWARARQRIEAAEPLDLSAGDINRLQDGDVSGQPVHAPVSHGQGGRSIVVPPRMGVPRFDACFDLAGLLDYEEDRDWAQFPELVEAERLLHSRDRRAALERLEEIREKYPDFDRVYLWIARVLREDGRSDDITTVLLQGLAEARSKAPLLTMLGIYAIEDGRLADGICWLIRSVALQVGGGHANSPQAFRYLACLAEPHPRIAMAREWLLEEAGKTDGSVGSLTREDADYCIKLSQTNAQPWMIDAMDALHGFYEASPQKEVDPAEA